MRLPSKGSKLKFEEKETLYFFNYDHGTAVVVGSKEIGLQEEILKVAISFCYFSLYL